MVVSNALLFAALASLVGITFVLHFRMLGVVNFAIVSYVLVASEIFVWLQAENESILWSVCCFIVSAMVVSVLTFVVNTFIYAPLRKSTPLVKSAATICVYLLIPALLSMIFLDQGYPQLPRGLGSIGIVGYNVWSLTVIMVAICFLFLSCFFYVYTQTIVGKKFRATMCDPDSARMVGVSRRSSEIILSIITGVFTSVSGIVALGVVDDKAYFIASIGLPLAGIAVAVVARQRNLLVCLIASLIIGTCVSIVTSNGEFFVRMLRTPVTLFGFTSDATSDSALLFALFVVPALLVIVGLLVSPLWDKEEKIE